MKNNLIIKLLLIPYFMFFVSAFAKQVPVKSIDNFNSNKPPKAIRFITLESEYVDNFGLIPKNSLITADIFSVKSEKRLKRDAQLLLKVKSIKNPETIKTANMGLGNLYAKYVEPKDKIEIAKYVPKNAIKNYYNVDIFNYVKYKILSSNDLSIYLDVDEGIENKIINEITKSNTLDELIINLKSKRYTYNKLSRMLIHILTGYTKEENKKRKNIKYLRILGFNKKGRKYLHDIKKKVTLPIYTNFNKEMELELKVTKIYSLLVNDESLIKKEIKNIIIKK